MRGILGSMSDLRDETAREYEAPGIVVTWEPQLCQHATECLRGLPAVFNARVRPWVRPKEASVDEVVSVVDRCPSYAMGYRTDDGRVRTPPHD